MKQFSHVSIEHGFTSLVQITKSIMTISVGNLSPVDFCKPDIVQTIKNIGCSATAGVLFNLDNIPQWNISLDSKMVFSLIVDHFRNNSMEMVAKKLLAREEEIFGEGKPSLQNQWNDWIYEGLVQFVTKSGSIASAEQEILAMRIIRKASPFFLAKKKHAMAEQFLTTEWPIVYERARSML